MEELTKYASDFNEIVRLVHNVNREIFYYPPPYLCSLQRQLELSHTFGFTQLDLKDIQQELSLIWIGLVRKFRKSKPNIGIRSWLKRMSMWEIRDWYISKMKESPDPPKHYKSYTKEPILFRLDLNFLLQGTSFFPLSCLNAYERYLIFLKFKQDKTIIEIADIVQKERRTVSRHIKQTLKRLRSINNATSNTRRSCKTGTRIPTNSCD
jgi:hypothetical protein